MIAYKRTRELWQVINSDVKEAGMYNFLIEVLLVGFIFPLIFLPITLIADTIMLPYDLIRGLKS